VIEKSAILKANLLIVDDKQANVKLLEMILRSAGYTSISSTMNPLEVCQLHLENHYDLILLDLQMPLMNGFAVMEGLKEIEIESYLPVLIITAQPEEKVHALNAGAKDFISKPFDVTEVIVRVNNMLEVRLLSAERKKLYEQVAEEQKISEKLLKNVLPSSIVKRLEAQDEIVFHHKASSIVDSFSNVSVLFADIVGFTKFSQTVSGELLVDVLNEIFNLFDGISDQWGMEKIKTIGDCYMAAAGIPEAKTDHAECAAHMALDMLDVMKTFCKRSQHQLHLRIGISSGSAVAGVIGKRKFSYDVWGDVVNTASRMESHGVADRIQISDSTQRELSSEFLTENRGLIELKGIGQMNTWFLNGFNARPSKHPFAHENT